VNGKHDVAEFVELFTEIQGDPPTAPFHWREWNDDEEKIKKKACSFYCFHFFTFLTRHIKGCLQNELIMYTLAHAHFAEFEDIPNPSDLNPSELPGGALILAMQAVSFALHLKMTSLQFISLQVEHAFKFWKTGEFVEDKTSQFSADNYGDTVKRKPGPDGRIKDVRVLNSGRYKPTVHSLSVDRHWVPIFNAVTRILNSTRKKKKARSKSASSRASSEMLIDDTPEYILVSDED
jgi:hypothetical protein